MSRADSTLVRELMTFLRRYVVMSNDQLRVVALWVVHTHAVESFEQTPYLAVTSPEKQCGKSRLLETLDLLVARPWSAILPSEAVVYRKVHQDVPTLLLDEVDAIFNPRTGDRYEGLRNLLNSGHRRGTTVPRCVGRSQQIAEFSPFCPKVIAGIGTLPDTVADRSIPIRLERRKPDERVKRFRRREVEPEAEALRERVAGWAERNAKRLRQARPEMPEELSDRMEEGCECLVAIADLMGVGKPTRKALIDLFGTERLDDVGTMRVRLLRDLRAVWMAQEKKHGKRVRALSTRVLLKRLCALEEAPWSSYYGHQLGDRDLAGLLHHFGVKSRPVRVGRGKGDVARGYRRDDLWPVWERYAK